MSNYKFNVVEEKRIDVILDSDVKNEADDQFALTHAILTPKFRLHGIIASHFGHDRIKDSMEASWQELCKIIEYTESAERVKIVKGAPTYLRKPEKGFFGKVEPIETEASELIIKTAHSLPVGRKLYIGVLGPLTNVASALLLDPSIEEKLIVIWNGGGLYPEGGPEFNLVNDIVAANIVFSSSVELWQIPTKTYAVPRVSLAEMQLKVRPCGRIGRFLFDEVLAFFDEMRNSGGWPMAESLDICDETVIALLMEEHRYCYRLIKAPYIGDDMFYRGSGENRTIRVYDEVDGRYVLEDLFAKLKINFPEEA